MNPVSRFIAGLVCLVSLVAAPSALAAIDYSKNAAGGTYAPADGSPAAPPAVSADAGFAWGDAALGAAVTVAVILVVVLLRRGLRTAPSIDRLRP